MKIAGTSHFLKTDLSGARAVNASTPSVSPTTFTSKNFSQLARNGPNAGRAQLGSAPGAPAWRWRFDLASPPPAFSNPIWRHQSRQAASAVFQLGYETLVRSRHRAIALVKGPSVVLGRYIAHSLQEDAFPQIESSVSRGFHSGFRNNIHLLGIVALSSAKLGYGAR